MEKGATMKKNQPANGFLQPVQTTPSTIYPLELVATVAATLAVRYTPVNDNSHVKKPVEEALALLETCEKEISKIGKPTLKERARYLNSDLGKKYPKGSFVKEIIRTTGQRTEAKALPIFKKFLAYEDKKDEAHRNRLIEQGAIIGADLETRIVERLEYYRHWELGGPRAERLEQEFRKWYEGIYLPETKRDSGSKGGRPKKKVGPSEK